MSGTRKAEKHRLGLETVAEGKQRASRRGAGRCPAGPLLRFNDPRDVGCWAQFYSLLTEGQSDVSVTLRVRLPVLSGSDAPAFRGTCASFLSGSARAAVSAPNAYK